MSELTDVAAIRSPEQMRWIRDRFKPDGLVRLARSTADYYAHKGYYLPDVAALAYANGLERDALAAELERVKTAMTEAWEHLSHDEADAAAVVLEAALAAAEGTE